ncbi:MAG: carboxypeptidase regulatory-like domain-containing protein [Candidatus Eisenbacteria sp.]|nr:carboxypeptidase regulatory-like domain-containing protein [Candidatus Eisenbacteria bacterium]
METREHTCLNSLLTWPSSIGLTSFLIVVLAMLCVATSPSMAASEEPTAVCVSGIDAGEIEELEQTGFDVAFWRDGYAEILASRADLDRLTELGYAWKPLDRDLFPGARAGLREGNMDPEYHTYQEMWDELLALEANYPEICKFYDIGDCLSKSYWWDNFSHEYDVFAVRISLHPDIDEPEPCIVYDGRHHAREPTTTELVMAIAYHFCENYGIDPEITDIVNTTEIWCVPMINADGHQWVEDIDPWWRKTLYDYNENHHVDNNEGIDPNRNYDWHWYAGSWSGQTYGGPYPWSAPCIVAMLDLHNLHRPAIHPTYHTYGEMIYYPFGYGVDPEPVVTDITAVYCFMTGYANLQSTTAHGSAKDWAYGTMGTTSFTVEIGTSFIPSGSTMLQDVALNLPASIWLATRLWGPSIQGTVTDSIAGIPLEATIYIPEIMGVYGGGELWDMKTEASTGYYCRMRPMSYQTITLEVSAEGYFDKTIQVMTGGDEATILNIELVPEEFNHGILTGMVTNATAGGTPVPGAAIELNGELAFETGLGGSYTGYVEPGVYTVSVSHPSFAPESTPGVVIELGETTVVDFSLTDIAGPEITGTTDYPNTDNMVGPYEIETTITDMSAIEEKVLVYRTTGQPFQTVPLIPITGNQFMGEIPGQPHQTCVQYYIAAQDEGGNESVDPPGAPSELYSFWVAPFITVYDDDMEAGGVDWTHYVVTGGFVDQWHLSTERNHTPEGIWSWKCGATGAGSYANLLDAALESCEILIGNDPRLTFWHWIDAEVSGGYPGQAYDGGIVEISHEGGPWEQITPVGGYSHTCRQGGTPGPFPAGTPMFSGTHDWEQVEFNLAGYEGYVHFRFRFGSDGASGGEGWYIDDVDVKVLGISSAVDDLVPERISTLQCTSFQCMTPVRGNEIARIAYRLSMPAAVHVRVFDAAGRLVRSMVSPTAAAEGCLLWDGRDAQGRCLGSGLYLMRLDAGGRRLATGKVVRLKG